jgi:hypothetical protein
MVTRVETIARAAHHAHVARLPCAEPAPVRIRERTQ